MITTGSNTIHKLNSTMKIINGKFIMSLHELDSLIQTLRESYELIGKARRDLPVQFQIAAGFFMSPEEGQNKILEWIKEIESARQS